MVDSSEYVSMIAKVRQVCERESARDRERVCVREKERARERER